MKIALLAPSGAGKTVYLAGLYGVLTNDLSNSNYGIDFSVPKPVLNSYLDERFTRLVEDHDFGEGSKDMLRYPFSLSTLSTNRGVKKINVEIVDFPGGYLHRASEGNREDVEKVIESLADCDGFIVLLDGEGLIKGLEKRDPRVLQNVAKAGAIQDVLAKALERRRERIEKKLPDPEEYAFGAGSTPIAFALTKGDLVENWLSQNPEEQGKKLQEGVGKQFKIHAGAKGEYADQEGPISNYIRSQFGKIVDDPDVCSLRTVVTVYNEAEEMLEPRNVETLFQFVLFTGLKNAVEEYELRKKSWDSENKKRGRSYDREETEYKRRKSDRIAWENQGFLGKAWDTVFGEGKAPLSRVEGEAHYRVTIAAEDYDDSKLSYKQAKENCRTAKLFYERILPDELVYRLTHLEGKDGFYHKGLPIESLSTEDWWSNKCEAGSAVFQSQKPPEPDAP